MLKEFGPEIWIADGTDVVAALGFHYPTRMAVIRLTDGDLFIWSPIALTRGLRAEVDSLGKVRHLVAPNSLHHVFIADWKRSYPDAYLYAPPGLREKRKDLDFDGDLANAPMPYWAGEIDQVLMLGNVITTEVVFFHAVVQALPPEMIRRLFKVRRGDLFNAPPRWNGAPTDKLMVIRRNSETGENSLDLIRWGLVPHFAKDLKSGASMINARCETVATKAAFRGAWGKKRRCLIPVDGFYEWRREGTTKQPYSVALKDGEPMALAGLWENWKDPATGEWVRTFTVLTTAPNELIAPFHDRMPVIILPEDQDRWLAGEDATELLKPLAAERLKIWPVSTTVNKVGNEGPELWDEVAA